MRRLFYSLGVIVAVGVLSAPASLQQPAAPSQPAARPGGAELSTGPYQVDPNWPVVNWAAPGYIWGSQAGVFPESADRVFLASRGELKLPGPVPNNFPGNWAALGLGGATTPLPEMRNVIVVVNREGRLIESWRQWDDLFEGGRGPHQIYISPYDPDRHVWVIDDMRHVIHKFTNDGKRLVQTIGELDEFGDDETHFRRPTMMAWLPDGTFFVSDGYGNQRVVKFDRTGKFLKKGVQRRTDADVHGARRRGGRKPGPRVRIGSDEPADSGVRRGSQLHRVLERHRAAHDRREHRRPHLGVRPDVGKTGQVRPERTPRVLAWGTAGANGNGRDRTKFWGVHQIAADQEGNLYVAEVFNGRTLKFRPRPGADSSNSSGDKR